MAVCCVPMLCLGINFGFYPTVSINGVTCPVQSSGTITHTKIVCLTPAGNAQAFSILSHLYTHCDRATCFIVAAAVAYHELQRNNLIRAHCFVYCASCVTSSRLLLFVCGDGLFAVLLVCDMCVAVLCCVVLVGCVGQGTGLSVVVTDQAQSSVGTTTFSYTPPVVSSIATTPSTTAGENAVMIGAL